MNYTKDIGRKAWDFLHTASIAWDINGDKHHLNKFIKIFALTYPCRKCGSGLMKITNHIKFKKGEKPSFTLNKIHNGKINYLF